MKNEINQLLVKEFGFNDGMRMAMVVMPNIIKDFTEKLEASLVGTEVFEEYLFDDRKGSITLYGIGGREPQGKITSVKINNTKIDY